jgi:hypothetical protein
LKAFSENITTTSISWTRRVLISSARPGTSVAGSKVLRKRGMSSSLAATNSTSAAMRVHAR